MAKPKTYKKCSICENDSTKCAILNVNYNGENHLLCNKHYQYFKRNGVIKNIKEEIKRKKENKKCFVCGISGKDIHITTTDIIDGTIRDICKKDYDVFLKYGRLKKKKENIYKCYDNYCTVVLHDKDGNITGESVFSAKHLDTVKTINWCLNKTETNAYVEGNVNGIHTSLHRFISNILFDNIEGHSIDHIDRDGLNNRDENLRLADAYIQGANKGKTVRNTSGVVGVDFSKAHQKWRARISYAGISKEETCNSFEEAVILRKKWEKERGLYLKL